MARLDTPMGRIWDVWTEAEQCSARKPGSRVQCALPRDHITRFITGHTILDLGHYSRTTDYLWYYWGGVLDEYQGPTSQDSQYHTG